jgi:hypothetical protein
MWSCRVSAYYIVLKSGDSVLLGAGSAGHTATAFTCARSSLLANEGLTAVNHNRADLARTLVAGTLTCP